jgi:hypothetical protein
MTATRRLAAILAADVVGYSRLTGEDEAGTARPTRMRARWDEAKAELAESRRLNPANHDQMDDRTHAQSSGRVRRPTQGGAAGRMKQV